MCWVYLINYLGVYDFEHVFHKLLHRFIQDKNLKKKADNLHFRFGMKTALSETIFLKFYLRA